MSIRSLARRLGVGVLTFILVAASPKVSTASDIIRIGFDLFDPLIGTQVSLGGVLYPFVGVPLGTFDFGPAFGGVHPTGSTDTIIERLDELGPGPGTFTIDVRLHEMQMVSTVPINLGSGAFFHYLTVGALSLGKMIWTEAAPPFHGAPPPAHGTASYDSIDWNFDVHEGSLSGPIVMSSSQSLSSGPRPWSHFAPPGAVLIPGVNSSLNGIDNQEDFFYLKQFNLTSTEGTTIRTRTAGAAVPEPMSLALFVVGIAGLAVRFRRRQRQR